jgi:hypothetical protein
MKFERGQCSKKVKGKRVGYGRIWSGYGRIWAVILSRNTGLALLVRSGLRVGYRI